MNRLVSSKPVEIQNGASAVLVGVLLLIPLEMSTFATAPGYRAFLDSGIPEEGWGFVFLILGLLQLGSALYDHLVIRRLAAGLLACLFAVYVAGVALGNPVSAAIPFVLPQVIGQVWAFYRIRKVA